MTESHTQIKAKCLECGLHFIVCTERPDTHSVKTLYCPECGQRNAQYLTWHETVPEPIFKTVPGKAELTPDMNVGEVRSLPKSALRPGKPRKLN